MRRVFRLFICFISALVLICNNLVPAVAENEITDPESIVITPASTTLFVGETSVLTTAVYPDEADQSMVWESSDSDVVQVYDDGTVYGNNLGKATITVITPNGKVAECLVRVLFTDVANSSKYFYNPVYWAFDNGVTTGTGQGEFSPSESCTREQFVTFLWRLMGEPEPENPSNFTDVKTNVWYYKPISWAYENGITTGLNDGTGRFGVGQACTREQCVTFLYRLAGTPEYVKSNTFADVKEGKYYYDAINWAAAKNITTGLNDGTGRFGVGQKCTRGMLVTFLYRYATSSNVNPFGVLCADEVYFVTNIENEVTFTVETTDLNNAIYLYSENSSDAVSMMNDDGMNGDETAGDSIYSCSIIAPSDNVNQLDYYASDGSIRTNTVTLYFFDPITEEDALEDQALQQELANIETAYQDENGFVPEEKAEEALNAVLDYVKALQDEGRVLFYDAGDYGITMKLSSGLSISYTPKVEGKDAVGSDVSMTVITCQPCYSMYQDERKNHMWRPDAAASKVGATFSNYHYSSANDYDNDEVTLDRIKSFGRNQVVIWHGHGGYSKFTHSQLVTGEDFDWNAYFWDWEYFCDCVADRIVEGMGRAMITSKFIDKYCGSMNNSFFYLAACSSGQDDKLANSFLNKGASAVVANVGSIISIYNLLMQQTIIELMCNINPDTDNYYTLSQALSLAKKEYGKNDNAWYYHDNSLSGSYPKIFGGASANNFQFADAKKGSLSGKVCMASNRSTPIPGAVVTITGNNKTEVLVTDLNGNYSASLPIGEYKVKIYAAGYIPFTAFATVIACNNTYMETFLMVEGLPTASGIASGKIYNATNGIGVPDVTLKVRSGWNNTSFGDVITELSTNSNGEYSLTLPYGNYTINAEKEGYITTSANIIVKEGTTYEQNCAIAPVSAGDSYRIILTWGENPSDLDSHLVGWLSNGGTFHVYYSNKNAYDGDIGVCNLDVDDTTSYGPETITLNMTTSQPYYYYIYRYAGSGTVGTSEARVAVYHGQDLLRTFNVPTNQGNGDYWNVFALVDGEMVIKNTITDSADVSYAGNGDDSLSAHITEALPAKEK